MHDAVYSYVTNTLLIISTVIENAIIVGKCITGSVSWELLQLKEQSVEMVPILYMFPPSPPVRSVLLCTKALGLNLEIKTVNLSNGEHLAPEFVQVNILHFFIFVK